MPCLVMLLIRLAWCARCCAAPGTVSTARPQTNHSTDEKAIHCMTSYHYIYIHLHWTIPTRHPLREWHSPVWNQFLHCTCSRCWGSHVDTAKLACMQIAHSYQILVSYALHIINISLSLLVGAVYSFVADIGSRYKKANQNQWNISDSQTASSSVCFCNAESWFLKSAM